MTQLKRWLTCVVKAWSGEKPGECFINAVHFKFTLVLSQRQIFCNSLFFSITLCSDVGQASWWRLHPSDSLHVDGFKSASGRQFQLAFSSLQLYVCFPLCWNTQCILSLLPTKTILIGVRHSNQPAELQHYIMTAATKPFSRADTVELWLPTWN